MENNLTNRPFWANYWKNYQAKPIPQKSFFDKNIPIVQKENFSFIEIGGFPGEFSVYFNKKFNCECSLLDFYIEKKIINDMERVNQIPEGSLICIEADFFQYTSPKKYDFVLSVGFIEHFENTKQVIFKHIDLMNDTSSLLIILPNFLGLNGWLQKIFDKENYFAHNLASMKITHLDAIMQESNIKQYQVDYIPKSAIWLERKKRFGNTFLRFVFRSVNLFLSLLPIKSKFLSSYIVISAQK